MDGDMITGLIAVIVSIIMANVFAAGMVAILHIWRKSMPHRQRVLVAVTATGAMPLVLASGAWITDLGAGGVGMAVGLLVFLVLAAAIALPLAIMVSRRLVQPVRVGDTFS